jgi:hypothetical protein
MHDPFGRIGAGASKLKGTKGRVHSLDEAMSLVQQSLLEGRYLEDAAGESFNHILNRFRTEVRNFEQGGDLDNDLYDALYDYYVECGEMPYGVQKARTGDPMRWVAEKLDAELGNIAYGQDPANAEHAEGIEMEGGIPGNLPPDQIPGKEDLLKGKGRSYYEEDSLEEELNELARLAGLSEEARGQWLKTKANGAETVDAFGQKAIPVPGNKGKTEVDEEETDEGNAFTGKLKDTEKGDEFELDGKEYKDTSNLDESINLEEEGDFNINTSMSTNGDKNVTVTATGEHAASLLQMLRMAGLGGSETAQGLEQQPTFGDEEGCEPEVAVIATPDHEVEMDEAGVDVAEPATEPANSPDPEYASMKGSTMGPGEGDAGEKAMNPDRPTKNNGDNALSNPPTRAQQVLKAVAALESKLAEEYESIKKIS